MPRRIAKPRQQYERTFIREWRKKNNLSQDRLVDRVRELLPTFSKASLSRIENGKQPYSQPILEAIGMSLNRHPADLLWRDPSTDDGVSWLIDNLRSATPNQRAQIRRIAEALLQKTG